MSNIAPDRVASVAFALGLFAFAPCVHAQVTGAANGWLSAPTDARFAAEPLPPSALVSVSFVPERATDVEVLQLAPVIGPVVTCRVPCMAQLPPGYVTVAGTGERNFVGGINIPANGPLTVRINHTVSNATLNTVGIAMSVVGVAAGIFAGVSMDQYSSSDSLDSGAFGRAMGGIMVGSLLLTALPTLMMVFRVHDPGPMSVVDPGDVLGNSSAGDLPPPPPPPPPAPTFASPPPVFGDARPSLSSVRFAGISPEAFPGGGGLVTGFTF